MQTATGPVVLDAITIDIYFLSQPRIFYADEIFAKRLERGTFTFPKRLQPDSEVVELDAHELMMLLEGIIEHPQGRHQRRWDPTMHHRFNEPNKRAEANASR